MTNLLELLDAVEALPQAPAQAESEEASASVEPKKKTREASKKTEAGKASRKKAEVEKESREKTSEAGKASRKKISEDEKESREKTKAEGGEKTSEKHTKAAFVDLRHRLRGVGSDLTEALSRVFMLLKHMSEIERRGMISSSSSWIEATNKTCQVAEDNLAPILESIEEVKGKDTQELADALMDVHQGMLERPDRLHLLSDDVLRFLERLSAELCTDEPLQGLAVHLSRPEPGRGARIPNAWRLSPEELASRLVDA